MNVIKNDNKVQLRLIYLVVSQLKFGMIAELLVWSALFGLLWHYGNHVVLTIWFVLSITFCIGRLVFIHYLKHHKITEENIQRVARHVGISALIAGASWGPLGLWLLPVEPTMQILIVFILVGTLAVANLFYSPIKNTYILFLVPAYGPQMFWLFSSGGLNIVIAFAGLAYCILMMILSHYMHLLLSDSIRSQYTRQELIDDLTNSNQKLREEIKEHEKAQEKLSKLNYQLVAISRCTKAFDRALYEKMKLDFIEEVSLQVAFEEALNFYHTNYGKSAITIKIEDAVTKSVLIDKLKLVHIFINLISNAVDSLKQVNNPEKILTLSATPIDKKHFQIKISDNGVGIAAECFAKLFKKGYTTKPHARGFGLYTCDLYTKDLGGEIHCVSEGLNHGASFIIALPYNHHLDAIREASESQSKDIINNGKAQV